MLWRHLWHSNCNHTRTRPLKASKLHSTTKICHQGSLSTQTSTRRLKSARTLQTSSHSICTAIPLSTRVPRKDLQLEPSTGMTRGRPPYPRRKSCSRGAPRPARDLQNSSVKLPVGRSVCFTSSSNSPPRSISRHRSATRQYLSIPTSNSSSKCTCQRITSEQRVGDCQYLTKSQ